MTHRISAERLELRSLSPTFLQAAIDGDLSTADEELGAMVPREEPINRELLALRLRQVREDPGLAPWLLRGMCHLESRTMIGHIGFHTRPGPGYLEAWVPGGVEFGVTVFAPFRRQGYAGEASRALMQWAGRVHGTTRFVMTIAPDNLSSQRLAASLGFRQIGTHEDEVDGLEMVLTMEL